MATAAPLSPLSPEERSVVSRVVDAAPPLRPPAVAEVATLLGRPRDPFVESFRGAIGGAR